MQRAPILLASPIFLALVACQPMPTGTDAADEPTHPTEFPALTGLEPKEASGVKQQIMVMAADHAMYADANARTLEFLGVR